MLCDLVAVYEEYAPASEPPTCLRGRRDDSVYALSGKSTSGRTGRYSDRWPSPSSWGSRWAGIASAAAPGPAGSGGWDFVVDCPAYAAIHPGSNATNREHIRDG